MNEPQKPLPPELFTPDEIVQVLLDFEQLLSQKQAKLNLPRNSPIEMAALTAIAMLDKFKGQIPHDFSNDNSKAWRQAIALADTLRKVLRAAKHPSFDKLWPHLLLLLGNTNVALNVWNPKEDQEANKIFELYMALVLAPLTRDLEPEDPVASAGGKNPDVIAHLSGERWSFACKVMHSDSPKSFIDRVRDGIDQIQNSDADKGIVVISLKNQLPHDKFWSLKRQPGIADLIAPGLVEQEIVTLNLKLICKGYHHQVITQLLGGPDGFYGLFKDTKAVPAVLLHFSTTTLIPNEGKPNFCFFRMFASLSPDPLPADLLAILEQLNFSLHNRSENLPNTSTIAASA